MSQAGNLLCSAAEELSDRLEKLFLIQLRNLLMDYVYLSEQTQDRIARKDFLKAAAWIEGKTRLTLGGELLTFEEAMAIYMNLDPGTIEFRERFSQFRRAFLQKANDPKWETLSPADRQRL